MATSRRGDRKVVPQGRDAAGRRTTAYETLKQAILSGELTPGQQLVETELATWIAVSRTPIREALTRLEHDGLVVRSDRGMVVRQRSLEEILDVYEVRLGLEATAGRIAAERRTAHEVLLLRGLLRAAKDVSSDDSPGMVEVNRRFHRAVWRATHNESLLDLLARLNLHLARYPETTLAYPGRWKTAIREHAQLVDAIEGRDGAAAYDIALAHFTAARDIRLALYDQDALSRDALISNGRPTTDSALPAVIE